MKFVQHIRFTTSKFDEMQKMMAEDSTTENAPGNPTYWILKDRDKPNSYVVTVVFDSYDEAMKNNVRPETQEFAAKMGELTDGPTEYGNYDLIAEG
jgi:quinol monooxygenase YgiN